MGHRGSSAEEPNGHFSMAEHADEWMESLGLKQDLLYALQTSMAKQEWAAMTHEERFKKSFKSFRNAFPNQPLHRIYQNALMECGYTDERRQAEAMARFVIAQNAKVGDEIRCPGCNALITKTSYQQKFCKEKKAGFSNCKDFINNWFSTKRLARVWLFTGHQPKHTPALGTPEVHDAKVSRIDAKPVTKVKNKIELDMIKQWLDRGVITKQDLINLS